MTITNPPIEGVRSPLSHPLRAKAEGGAVPARERIQIGPEGGWSWIDVGELWRHRELILILCSRDIKVRYKQTALGAAWAVFQPAMMMIVFTVFLGRMGHVPTDGTPYPLFVYAGLIPWSLFAATLNGASNSVVASERLVTKIYFPRLAIPFAAAGAPVADFTIALGLLFVLMLYYGVAPGAGMLLIPGLLVLLVLAAMGIGILFAALNVFYRDIRHIVPYLVQIGLFATPTIYMQPRPGEAGRWATLMMVVNPMTTIVAAFRAAMLGGPIPWGPLALTAAAVVAVFVLACLYFRKVEDGFADAI